MVHPSITTAIDALISPRASRGSSRLSKEILRRLGDFVVKSDRSKMIRTSYILDWYFVGNRDYPLQALEGDRLPAPRSLLRRRCNGCNYYRSSFVTLLYQWMCTRALRNCPRLSASIAKALPSTYLHLSGCKSEIPQKELLERAQQSESVKSACILRIKCNAYKLSHKDWCLSDYCPPVILPSQQFRLLYAHLVWRQQVLFRPTVQIQDSSKSVSALFLAPSLFAWPSELKGGIKDGVAGWMDRCPEKECLGAFGGIPHRTSWLVEVLVS